MISKKNKALCAGVLAAAMSASAIVPTFASAAENKYATEGGANESYAKMFESLYDDVITNGEKNGYLSKNNNGSGSFGIPYHVIETLCVEAPDYGHETTSEAMSYMAWITAMHDVLASKKVISGSTGDLQKGWKTLEAMIPGWSANAYQGEKGEIDYSSLWKLSKVKADTTTEEPEPSGYPAKQNGVDAYNPIFKDFKSAYGSDPGYYLMHWLADVEDWYKFGGGKGQFTFINTFQRGEQESCFETVPQGCIEELKYGMSVNDAHYKMTGIKAVINGWEKEGALAPQYSFTNAPDAEDRAIQAIYFASMNGLDCGEISGLAAKMGDQCRNDMFDKYYKAIGCQSIDAKSDSESASHSSITSQHFLMAWYTAWGGSTFPWYAENNPSGNYDWAFQIGCSHSHQFYQNPLAAYALAYDPVMSKAMKASDAVADYKESFKRQIEFYLWLQSKDGPFAGGCTNSKGGQYQKYDSSDPLFYDMCYVEHPVYADPGSNHWIGNQVWSTQRLAELYYYVKKNGDLSKDTFGGLSLEEALETLLTRWVTWFIDNTEFDYTDKDGNEMAYAIPASLDWSGKPATWNNKYDAKANDGLTCTITAYGQSDVGCVSSLCNTLIYFAAANGVDAAAAQKDDNTELAAKGLYLANRLMSAQWNTARDEKGIAYEEHNGSLYRIFEQEVFIPKGFDGEMPDGSPIKEGVTFSDLRQSYASDPMYKEAKEIYEKNKAAGKSKEDTMDGHTYTLHRFWHIGDALMTTGTMALLYPEVTPLGADNSGETTTTTTATTTTTGGTGDTLWGDANVDGKVTVADATAILQSIANQDKYALKPQGKINADVVDGDGVTSKDALAIQMMDAQLIKQADFPTTSTKIDSLK